MKDMIGTLLGPIDNLKEADMRYKEREYLQVLARGLSADKNSICGRD
jgi:hypothetical protein